MTSKIRKCIVALLTLLMLFGTNISVFAGNNGGNGNSGSIWTTNGAGKPVDQNIYSSKDDVYLNGGPVGGGPGFTPGDQYLVRVIAPGGEVLGMSTEFVTVAPDGTIPGKQLSTFLKTASSRFTIPGYDDTSNTGGEYQVEIGNKDSAGVFQKNKSDNFKVNRGTLTITKVVPGEGNDPTGFQILVEGVGFTFSNTYTIKEGTPTLIEGLVAGTYNVTELPNNYYTTQAPNPIQIIVGAGSWTHYLTFTNVPRLGTLTVLKDVTGNDVDTTEFDVTITGVAPTVYNRTEKIKEGSPAVITDIPVGDYLVTETTNLNYSTTLPNPKPVHIGGATDSEWNVSVTFVNTKLLTPPPRLGTLTILKDVPGDDVDTTEFDVTITGVAPTVYIRKEKIKEGPLGIIIDIPEGDYLVTETTNLNYSTALPNPKPVHIGGATDSEWNVSVTFVNTKLLLPPPPSPGTLTISKNVDNVNNDPTEFEVTITGVAPTVYNGTAKIKEGVPAIITEMPAGDYLVRETSKTGYNTALPNPKQVHIGGEVAGSSNVSIEFINSKTGTLSIQKDVDNIPDDPTYFDVTITGPNNYTNAVRISEHPEAPKVLLTGLEEGWYTVTELGNPLYSITQPNPKTTFIGDDVQGYSWNGGVRFTNTRLSEPLGEITINKNVDNVNNDPTEFEVVVTGVEYRQIYKVKEGTPTYVRNLHAGTYTLTESLYSGYTIKSTNPVTVVIGDNDGTVWYQSVAFTNTKNIIPPPPPSFPGTITINKDVNNVENDTTGFQVTVTGPVNSTAVIKEGSPALISGLPAGTYTITEQMPAGYTNVNGNPIVLTIGQDNWNGTATFVNQKTITPPENETPGGPVVPDEEVPVGPPNLPATGELPPALFYLLGAAVISIGTIIRKK